MPLVRIKNIHTKIRCPQCDNEVWKSNRFYPIDIEVDLRCSKCETSTKHKAVQHDVQVFKDGE